MKRKESSVAVKSTNDLRFDFGRVLKAVKAGKSMIAKWMRRSMAAEVFWDTSGFIALLSIASASA